MLKLLVILLIVSTFNNENNNTLSLGVMNCEFYKCTKWINSTNLVVAYIQKNKGNMYVFIGNMVSTKQTGSEMYFITFCGLQCYLVYLKN